MRHCRSYVKEKILPQDRYVASILEAQALAVDDDLCPQQLLACGSTLLGSLAVPRSFLYS